MTYKSKHLIIPLTIINSLYSTGAYQNAIPSMIRTPTSSSSSTLTLTSKLHTRPLLTLYERYTKGAEIYPPTNQNSFTLADSFPNGIIPAMATSILMQEIKQDIDMDMEDASAIVPSEDVITTTATITAMITATVTSTTNTSTNGRKRKLLKNAYGTLKSAAKAQKQSVRNQSKSKQNSPLTKLPPIIALTMLALGLVSPSQILWVVFISGYLIALGILASSPRVDCNGLKLVLPNLPPQSHVPALVSNPLGTPLTQSATYQNWLKWGVSLGYMLPLVAVGWYKYTNQLSVAKHVATGVFLISCQIMTESITKRILAPLPLRIFVPLAYNAMRMGPLYDWIMAWNGMAIWGRLLAVGNFVYWGANLFGFLVPVASMRYMRSHFFCVDAEEVVLREAF